MPEDWVGSTTSIHGEAPSGLSVLPDGRLLRDADPAVLVKLLDAGERLPVHCHPDREFARERLGPRYGKSEAWLILDGGTLHLGFRDDVDPETLRGRLLPGEETAVAFAVLDRDAVPEFLIYGDGIRAAMVALEPVLEEAVAASSAVMLGSNTMVGEAERRVTLRARELAVMRGAHVLFDWNLRLRCPARSSVGFDDAILQMWAAFLDELAHGRDGMRQPFHCATPEEAAATHRLFTAALRSHAERSVVEL